jgi:membrane protein
MFDKTISRIRKTAHKAGEAYEHICRADLHADRRFIVHLLRIVSLTWHGLSGNAVFSRAGALSYSSLFALAPVLGVIVLFTSSFLEVNPEAHIKRAIFFIAPSMEQYVGLDEDPTDAKNRASMEAEAAQTQAAADPASAPVAEAAAPVAADSQLGDALDLLIRTMVEGAQASVSGINTGGKGLAGTIGGLLLIWCGITLLVAIENSLNSIWGVRRGRTWGKRIVLYWAVLSLGVLSVFALMGLISASTIAGMLHAMPFGGTLAKVLVFVGPAVSYVALIVLLTFFYQFFPNTNVRFLPALAGGFLAATALVLNNLLSILYINHVIEIQSLYGSMGIVLVLMFGLYMFWVFLLVGGQITYAVQNVHFIADQRAWNNISSRTRETITFAALALIARRFAQCEQPLAADELSRRLCVPSNILNESLARLIEMGYVTALTREDEEGAERRCFAMARPLRTISLSAFRATYDTHGSNIGADSVRGADPLVGSYRDCIDEALGKVPASTLEALIDAIRPDEADANA